MLGLVGHSAAMWLKLVRKRERPSSVERTSVPKVPAWTLGSRWPGDIGL